MPSPRVLIRAAGGLFVVVLAGVVAQAYDLLEPDAAATLEAGGAVLGLLAVLASVRARVPVREADRALLGDALLASSTVACYTLDREGRVGTWSRGAETLFGWRAADIEGLPLTGTIHARPQEGELLAEVQRLLESGGSHAPHVCAVTNREGRTFETVCILVPLAERSKAGRVAVMHVDPHSPQLAEGRWSRLFHAAPAGLLRVDGSGRIEAVNRRFTEWTGRKTEAIEGTDVDRCELFPEDFRRQLLSAALPERDGGRPRVAFECTVTLVAADGATRPCVAVVAPRAGAGADVALVDGTARERLKAERDAARAAADEARKGATDAVTTQKDLTSSVAELMSALETTRNDGTPSERRRTAEDDLKRSGSILLASIQRLGETPGGRKAGPPQVLLVDDNDENRELIARMLRTRGAVVTSLGSGREAVDAVSKAWFDVVLLDLQMPEMDGYEVVRKIRALPGGEAISVVALTALGPDGIRERCLAEGMDDFVSKPLTLAKVGEILNRWGPPRSVQPRG